MFNFQAEDPDLNDQLVYSISESSYDMHGENLVQNYSELLSLNHVSGILSLNSYVANNMKGFLKFSIDVFDSVEHKDTASVKIYIVSENNRVKFLILSDIQVIRENEQFVSIANIIYLNIKLSKK